jgi:hypothetical protein
MLSRFPIGLDRPPGTAPPSASTKHCSDPFLKSFGSQDETSMGCRTYRAHQPRVELITEQFTIRFLAQWCSTAKPNIQSVWPNHGIYQSLCVMSITGPAILPWMLHHTSPHRI